MNSIEDQRSPDVSQPLPASRGIAWIRQSWSLLQMQAGRLLLIAVLMQLILGLTQVPLLGMLVVVSVPALSAGILEAFHTTGRGHRPALSLLFKPLSSGGHAGRLFAVGALVFIVAVVSISVLLPSGEQLPDAEIMSRIQQGDMDAVASLDPAFLKRTALSFLVGVAISGALSYFTVPLIWFRDQRLLAALGGGLKAMWLNWRAFLVLLMGLAVLSFPVGLIIGILFGMASGSGLGSVLFMGLIMMLLLLYQMLLFGTQYCAFREVFGLKDEPEPPADREDGQLLA